MFEMYLHDDPQQEPAILRAEASLVVASFWSDYFEDVRWLHLAPCLKARRRTLTVAARPRSRPNPFGVARAQKGLFRVL